jgi:hypothetical protein
VCNKRISIAAHAQVSGRDRGSGANLGRSAERRANVIMYGTSSMVKEKEKDVGRGKAVTHSHCVCLEPIAGNRTRAHSHTILNRK